METLPAEIKMEIFIAVVSLPLQQDADQALTALALTSKLFYRTFALNFRHITALRLTAKFEGYALLVQFAFLLAALPPTTISLSARHAFLKKIPPFLSSLKGHFLPQTEVISTLRKALKLTKDLQLYLVELCFSMTGLNLDRLEDVEKARSAARSVASEGDWDVISLPGFMFLLERRLQCTELLSHQSGLKRAQGGANPVEWYYMLKGRNPAKAAMGRSTLDHFMRTYNHIARAKEIKDWIAALKSNINTEIRGSWLDPAVKVFREYKMPDVYWGNDLMDAWKTMDEMDWRSAAEVDATND